MWKRIPNQQKKEEASGGQGLHALTAQRWENHKCNRVHDDDSDHISQEWKGIIWWLFNTLGQCIAKLTIFIFIHH